MINLLSKITVTEITDVITFHSPRGRIKTIENRETYGLSFCTEGQITYTHKGKSFISDKNHAIILPQNETYLLHGDKTGVFPVINFKCLSPLCDTMLLFPVRNPEGLIRDYEQIKSLFLFENKRLKIISIFYDIIQNLADSGSHTPSVLVPAIEYIEKSYSDFRLTNEALAEVCGISEVHFRKLFLRRFKTTPKQYVINIRVDKAKQLLCEGRKKINVIAEECGFSNQYHFCRVFKDRTGLTPSEYIKQNKIRGI